MQTHDSPPPAPDAACCAHKSAFEILSTCHEHIQERLLILELVGRELTDAEQIQDSHLARLGDVLAFLDTAIPIHSADEEQSLFPRLRLLPPFAGSEGTPMDCMQAEHVDHRELLARLKLAITQRDAAAAGRWAIQICSEYRSHIGKEEEVLYPMARELLSDPNELARMAEEMLERRKKVGLLSC